jgi:tetratricopeptide (TPR) repeat protein
VPWTALATGLAVAAGAAWALWRGPLAAPLPAERNLALLAPRTPGADEDFASFALGAVEVLGARLRRHQSRAGFQLAPFSESVSEKLATATEARKIQGANLALLSSFEQGTDTFRAQLELWDAGRSRRIATRTVETPAAKPFVFLDRVEREATAMLGLPARGDDAVAACGVRGAGTLRYLLQGIGRSRSATTAEQSRRAVDDLELACNTEPEAAVPRARLALAELKVYALGDDRGWLERAEVSARAAVERDSSRAEPFWALADALARKNDPAGSLAAYRRAGALDPADDWVALRTARTWAQLGQPERERETYAATIAARPHCWQPYWWLATWHTRRGETQAASGAYRDMIRTAPALYRGYAGLGGILVLEGAYDRAIDTLKISIALRPNEAAFGNLGTAYFHSGRLEQAVEAYNQSFQFGFASYQLWLNLGDAYYWLRGRRDQAANAYTQAVKMGREEGAKGGHDGRTFDVLVPAHLSTIFPKIGQADSARVYLQRALSADSTNAMVQYCAALTFWQLDERERAMDWLERAVRNGYPVAWLRDSPVFDEWRGEAAFRALIAGASPPMQRSAAPTGGGRT